MVPDSVHANNEIRIPYLPRRFHEIRPFFSNQYSLTSLHSIMVPRASERGARFVSSVFMYSSSWATYCC